MANPGRESGKTSALSIIILLAALSLSALVLRWLGDRLVVRAGRWDSVGLILRVRVRYSGRSLSAGSLSERAPAQTRARLNNRNLRSGILSPAT